MKLRTILGTLAVLAILVTGSTSAYAQCSEGELISETCDGVTFEGCCDSEKVQWCDNADGSGPLCGIDCGSTDAFCSWNPDASFYVCADSKIEGPAEFPMACGPCVGSCEGKECGSDGCEGDCGSCDDGLVCGSNGMCCTPTCDGATCGPDGCGGTCGDCACGENCVEGACVFAMCEGAVCGDDGCGGSCGACADGEVCGADGQCCTPSCDGKECGDDGCGGDCGFCGCGLSCDEGTCTYTMCAELELECGVDACGVECGTCSGDDMCIEGDCVTCDCTDKACGDDGCGGTCGECDAGVGCVAGVCTEDIPAGCESKDTPGCDGCACEACVIALDDWCGSNEWDGLCASMCENDCGQACPTFACEPMCDDEQECGDDGCGGTCGKCEAGEVCATKGPDSEMCVAEGEWFCDPSYLGADDGCDCDCGAYDTDCDDAEQNIYGCESYQTCDEHGMCMGECVPDCEDEDGNALTCGDDGCGGTCGVCFGEFPICDTSAKMCIEDGCNGYDFTGCCDNGTSFYCEDNEVFAQDCAEVDPTFICGWYDAQGYYACGPQFDEDGTTVIMDPNGDPEGNFPMDCGSTCMPDCMGKACDANDGCGGTCGCPDGLACTLVPAVEGDDASEDSMQCLYCTPNCFEKACGDDGCGNSCGECGADESCFMNACCTPTCADGQMCGDDGCGGQCGSCGAGESCEAGQCINPCGDITYEGCCEGGIVKWCEDGAIQEVDCVNNAQSPGPTCGWAESEGYYWCNETGADPSGTFPENCDGCEPIDCTGLACNADNGCDGTCGCAAGETCEAGVCEACVPNCMGVTCGDDGCGGSCGECAEGESCHEYGQCVEACMGISYEGCCSDDGVAKYCDGGQLFEIACTENPSCGWNGEGGYYDCGTDGNPDASGANPMECPVVGIPNCKGKECGDDGLGGSCGTCTAPETCDANGLCAGDVPGPDCTGKVCGPDGIGGSCGDCAADETCDADGQCVGGTEPDCTDKVCGDDGMGGSCGECADGETCQAGACVADPVADCTNKTCGDDGAGGSCGACAEGETCTDFACVDDGSGGNGGSNGGGGGGGGGCTVDSGSQPGALALLFALVLMIPAVLRRRQLI